MTDGVPSLDALLAARESRAARQRALVGAHARPVVSVTCVAPGPTKRSPAIERVFGSAATGVALELAQRGWPVMERVELHPITGPELQLAVDAPASELKTALVGLEEGQPWGRLWDLDVVVDDGPLSRPAAGRPPRRCLVCDEAAAGCARSARHDPQAIAAAVERIVAARAARPSGPRPTGRDAAPAIGAWAAEALRVEARLAPKPGLVDALDNGAHADMTLHHFLVGADALEPWFATMAELGATPGWGVAHLQALGREAEQAMLDATGGLNTHRGAIFIVGWLSALAGGALSSAESDPPSGSGLDHAEAAPRWSSRLSQLSSPLLREWQSARSAVLTHGRAAFDAFGLPGARGEVASGLRSVVTVGLPRYRRARSLGWAADDALLAALLGMLAVVDDTNLISRGGIEGLRSVQQWARSIERRGLVATELRDALASANERFSECGWSPGGVADLLAATWFVDQVLPAG